MKRRKGVTVVGILTLTFLLLAAAGYFVTIFATNHTEFGFIDANKNIINAFAKFDLANLLPSLIVFIGLGVYLIIGITWLIVDLLRHRKIVFLFLLLSLLSYYATILLLGCLLPELTTYTIVDWKDIAPITATFLAGISTLFAVILFVSDVVSGHVERDNVPTFIEEPTPENEDGVFEEIKDEEEVTPEVKEENNEVVEEKPTRKTSSIKKVDNKKPTRKTTTVIKKSDIKKEEATRKTGVILTNEVGASYAKAYHVSRRPELNKWQVKATGSDKALKLFNTQKEAIEYADQLAKSQNVSIRVHSKEGKIRKHK